MSLGFWREGDVADRVAVVEIFDESRERVGLPAATDPGGDWVAGASLFFFLLKLKKDDRFLDDLSAVAGVI